MWYAVANVRLQIIQALALAILVTAACGHGQVGTISLSWRGVDDSPAPSPLVAESFASAPFTFALRDVRPDPSAVGTYEDDGFVVRTRDNVAQYCSSRVGDMLARAGARLNEPPTAATATRSPTMVETELVEYRVIEGGTFNGKVRIRAIVHHDGVNKAWSKIYEGKSKRWGRSHSPENFNEALSNALADATSQLVRDNDFAHALLPHSASSGG